MQNKLIEDSISAYLTELKQTLSGQDPSLIQDALYDAEEHLRAALEDVSADSDNFKKVCEDYGSPQEIAEFYCEMEAKVSLALNGAEKRSSGSSNHKFWGVLSESSAYLAMLYMILGLPLGIAYFGWVMIAGFGSLTASVFVIGIPALLLFLGSMQLFSLFEGRLIEALLGQRMPRRPLYQSAHNSANKPRLLERLKQVLKNKRNWTTALYLLLKFPIGLASFIGIFGGGLFSLAIMLSPIVDPILHAVDPSNTIDLDWYWFPVALPAGFIGFVLCLHLAKLLGRLQARLARYMLVSIDSGD